ncbi:MAG: NADH-quinone oxidoreductase subunit N [Acidobacteria bacterium]|nr:NADH-quinone oxidoreductase subunit N [Acidobacteriota bacterium]
MNAVSLSDVVLLLPEMILVGIALALMLTARRIQKTSLIVIGTVLAAAAAAVAAGWILTRGTSVGFGGMIIVDGYSQFFKMIIATTLAVAALLSVRTLEGGPRAEYHTLLLLASTGMMLAVSARDLLPLYLGLELMTLCAYILVGIRVDKVTSNEAALKYFLLGSFASALLVYGISLVYGITATTDFVAIASVLSTQGARTNPLLLVAIGLVAAGLAFKIAAVPLHAWAPDAYQGASAPVAGFLASGSKAVGLAALGRVTLTAFGSEAQALSMLLAGLAGLSIVVGSVIALSQTDMKRLLAYSSIAHAGYALLGLIAGTGEGATATMTYAFFYVFMTLGAFGVVIALGDRGENLDGYQGLAAQRPGMALLMLLFLMSLTGIPPTAGFAAKFVVILSAVRAGYVGLAVLAVACSVVSAFFYMRVAVFMYMSEPQEPAPSRLSPAVFAALAVAGLVTLIGGVSPGALTAWTVSP